MWLHGASPSPGGDLLASQGGASSRNPNSSWPGFSELTPFCTRKLESDLSRCKMSLLPKTESSIPRIANLFESLQALGSGLRWAASRGPIHPDLCSAPGQQTPTVCWTPRLHPSAGREADECLAPGGRQLSQLAGGSPGNGDSRRTGSIAPDGLSLR